MLTSNSCFHRELGAAAFLNLGTLEHALLLGLPTPGKDRKLLDLRSKIVSQFWRHDGLYVSCFGGRGIFVTVA